MTSLVDVDNIIKQAKEIELNKLKKKQNLNSLESKSKGNFWQRFFGKEKHNFATSPRKTTDSKEQLDKIINLRKQLGMDDLSLPTKPHILDEPKLDEDLNLKIEETESDFVDMPTKTGLDILRSKLGLDEEPIKTKQLYDQLEQEANENIDQQTTQYEHEQLAMEEELKPIHESLFTSDPEVISESAPEKTWVTEDATVGNDFLKQSSKMLEEENFVIPKFETNLEEVARMPKPIEDEATTILEKDIFEEELLSKSLDEQLERTTTVLEKLEHGDVPKEDLLKHLEHGVSSCMFLIGQNNFLDAKYRYNDLCQFFNKINLTDQDKTKWFGVLKKTYDKILSAEKL
jgi:hypothetical protein